MLFCKSCYYQIRCIANIRPSITTEACKTLVKALVISRLDYDNALLYSITLTPDSRLQRIQREHITTVLLQLHWLPVRYRTGHKILLHTFKVITRHAPVYLNDPIQRHRPVRVFWNQYASLLGVRRTNTVVQGRRSFSYSSPYLCVRLPEEIKSASSQQAFGKVLKTDLFNLAYS